MSAQMALLTEPKLGRQNQAVYESMRTGIWWTLPLLAAHLRRFYGVPISEAGLSARIRDLRKAQYGGHTILKHKTGSLWEYRMTS